jgi:hypothetical protein
MKCPSNLIVECLDPQVDADIREFMLLKDIVDNWSDGLAVPISNTYYVDPNSKRNQWMTTRAGSFLSNRWMLQWIGFLFST